MKRGNSNFGIVVLLAIITVNILGYLGSTLHILKLSRGGIKTSGEIVSYEISEHRSRGGTYNTYRPVVEFNLGNEVVTAVDKINNSTKEPLNMGSKVEICYDSKNPEKIMINNPYTLYLDKTTRFLRVLSILMIPLIFIMKSKREEQGKSCNFKDLSIKNKMVLLAMGLIPTLASILILVEFKLQPALGGDFLGIVISVSIIVFYFMAIGKTILSIIKNNNKNKTI